jgi:hypothetical protein
VTERGSTQTRRPRTPELNERYIPPSGAQEWLTQDPDAATRTELRRLLDEASQGNEHAQHELTDAFRGPLAFGTAGIRAPMGPGPHRMNRITVAQAAAGIASYLNEHHTAARVIIGYDARHHSRTFAYECAAVLSGAGLDALILPEPLPRARLPPAITAKGGAVSRRPRWGGSCGTPNTRRRRARRLRAMAALPVLPAASRRRQIGQHPDSDT